MQPVMVTIQGQKRVVNVAAVKQLIADNPAWGRTRISEELCREWNWHAANGQPRDMACRTLLLKLERCGAIRLPERKRKSTNHYRNRRILHIPHSTEPVICYLQDLLPLSITVAAQGSAEQALFRCLLAAKHVGLWDAQKRPPPRAGPASQELQTDYSTTQIVYGGDYSDPDYPFEAYL